MRILLLLLLAAFASAYSGMRKEGRCRQTAVFSNYSQHKKQNAKFSGIDFRYNSTTPESEQMREISKIRDFFRKKEMIAVLSHPSVPTETKLQLIDDSLKNVAGDIFAGGLMNQWDFDGFD
jgi:predicted dienelactone hydrolase